MKMFRSLCVLLALAFLASCSKDKDKETESELPYYFKATINGKQVKFDENSQHGNGSFSDYSGYGWDNIDYSEGTIFQNYLDQTHNTVGIYILKHFNDDPTTAQRLAMIHTGNYGYGKAELSPATIDGATIGYVDDQGVEWSSEQGDQTGSTFTITELSNNPDGTSLKIFKATFSCKLYNAQGQSIQVSNGEVRGQVFTN